MKKKMHTIKFRNDIISFISIVEITQYKLRTIWSSYFSDKPFPQVRAFILEDDEFILTNKRLKTSPATFNRNFIEYGHDTLIETDIGLIFPAPNGVKVILVKEHSMNYTLDEILEHELRHAYNGEANTIKEKPE